MKKNTKSPRWLLSTLILSCILCYSCLEEDWHNNNVQDDKMIVGNNKELTRSAAQQWYEENNLPVTNFRSSENSKQFLTKPDWEYAKESKKAKYEVVETPLMLNGGIMFMDADTKQKFNLKTDAKRVHNIARMVVIKNLKTGDICNFIMIFVGKYDYLKSTRTVGKNSYLHREPDFEGDVYFYKPGEGFVNGWRYEKGKLVAKISPGSEEGFLIITTKGMHQECYTDVTWVEYNDCWGEPSYDEEFGWGVTSTCQTVSYPEYTEVCNWVDDGSDGDWPPGEGGGGGYNPPTNPPDIPADKKPIDYIKRDDDHMAKKNLPTTMNKQILYTCVTAIMEYANNKVYGGNTNEGVYWQYYLNKTDK